MSTAIVIARQPIVDRQACLCAYELLFRPQDTSAAPLPRNAMSGGVIADMCMSIGLQATLEGHRGYLNLTRDLLFSEGIEALPPELFVLEILEGVAADDALVERCRHLRRRGFTLALDDFVPGDPRADLLTEVDLVKVDLVLTDRHELPRLTRGLRRKGLRLLAEKVETQAEFERCMALGFELFQGYFFARPELVSGRGASTASVAVLGVLQLLEADAGMEDLLQAIKPHTALSIKLLRLVNSAGLGVSEEISGLGHALAYLGRSQLKRWLLILLFAAEDRRGKRSPLLWLAATRGRALELLAKELSSKGQGDVDPDSGFTIGMLSVAHALLGLPLEELTESLHLDEVHRAALLQRRGPLGCGLTLLEHLEYGRFDAAASRATEIGVQAATVSRFVAEATVWVAGSLAGRR